MPKQRITKEMVIDAAFQIAQSEGAEAVLVKRIAETLGCSVQPIYSYCKNMEELRDEIARRAGAYIREAAAARVDPQDMFRSTGRAYVQLAREEPHLFRMFLFQKRENIASLSDFYDAETNRAVAERIAAETGMEIGAARQLHLNMLIYTTGIGTIYAVCSPGIPEDEIAGLQEAAYRAFLQNSATEDGACAGNDGRQKPNRRSGEEAADGTATETK